MEEKRPTLIVSGLGTLDEYLFATAIALRVRPCAEIAFSSRSALPDVLQERAGGAFGEVLLLGVGLSAEAGRLLAALEAFRRHGARIVWISVAGFAVPPAFAAAQFPLDVRECAVETLPDAVAASLGGHVEDLLAAYRDSGRSGTAKAWRERLAAVEWNFANTRDFHSLESFARDLADRVSPAQWDGASRRLVENYLQFGYRRLETSSPAMRRLRKDIGRVARSGAMRVLVTGESGVGKETVAQQIHVQSGRRGPFLAFNCATVAKELLESRLFGHARGAFTGAVDSRPGLFREADGGTLFLDEIGELPVELQGVLLRALQEGRIQPVGEPHETKVDVRVVTATNRDLAALVHEGRFRADLYWRLSAVEIHVPPLRERAEDFRPIAQALWRAFAPKRKPLPPATLEMLASWSWPGNVRQLGNVLERAALFEDRSMEDLLAEEKARSAALSDAPPSPPTPPAGADAPLDVVIRAHVRAVWERHGRNVSVAARILGISRNTLRAKLGEDMPPAGGPAR